MSRYRLHLYTRGEWKSLFSLLLHLNKSRKFKWITKQIKGRKTKTQAYFYPLFLNQGKLFEHSGRRVQCVSITCPSLSFTSKIDRNHQIVHPLQSEVTGRSFTCRKATSLRPQLSGDVSVNLMSIDLNCFFGSKEPRSCLSKIQPRRNRNSWTKIDRLLWKTETRKQIQAKEIQKCFRVNASHLGNGSGTSTTLERLRFYQEKLQCFKEEEEPAFQISMP